MPIKGLQRPAANQATAANADIAPTAEEIKLAPQKLRSGEAALLINVELPAGYHLNPDAPQRYKVSVAQGGETLSIDPANSTRSTKGLPLPIRVPFGVGSAGAGELRASFTFVYCREDNTGTCRIRTLVWRAPVEVVSDPAAPAEIKMTTRVKAE